MAKSTMVDLIQAFAAHVGTTPGAVITGHALRTTGAQRMAEASIEEGKIRTFGRWASDQMLKYTREALIADSHRSIAQVFSAHCCSFPSQSSLCLSVRAPLPASRAGVACGANRRRKRVQDWRRRSPADQHLPSHENCHGHHHDFISIVITLMLLSW